MPDISSKNRFRYGLFQCLDKLLGRKLGYRLTLSSRQKLYKDIEVELKGKVKGKLTDVKRVKNISLKNLKRQYINKNKPVIIEGGALNWACCKEWSLDYFKNLHGEDEITIVANDTREIPFENIKLKELISNINSGGSKYFRFYPLLTKHPEHLKDFDYNWLRKVKNKWSVWEQFQVFIGGKNTSTPIHNAMASNIFIQAFGEKEWVLYKPEFTAIIDPNPGINFHREAPFKTTQGPFNSFKTNYENPYSLYKYIDGIRVYLKPGDIFFNPPHYWHSVQNPTNSIGIGYRWISPFASFKSAPLYTFLDCITAPFNKHIYLHWKKDYIQVHLMELGLYEKYKKEKNSPK